MRNFSVSIKNWDKKYFLAFLITLACSIICGIVLYKPAITNIYFINFASDYVYNVFNFNNSALFLTHFLGSILYSYLFFFICYFTKFKYITLLFLYFRGLFFGIYVTVLICLNAVSGVLVAIFVFIPATIISVAICYIIAEFNKKCDLKYGLIAPAIFVLIDCIILMLLVNVVFRVVIIIV